MNTNTHIYTPTCSLSFTNTHTDSLSHTHTHTHTYILSLSTTTQTQTPTHTHTNLLHDCHCQIYSLTAMQRCLKKYCILNYIAQSKCYLPALPFSFCAIEIIILNS